MTEQTEMQEKQEVPVARLVASWVLVGVPLAWGVFQTFLKALPLFTGGDGG